MINNSLHSVLQFRTGARPRHGLLYPGCQAHKDDHLNAEPRQIHVDRRPSPFR